MAKGYSIKIKGIEELEAFNAHLKSGERTFMRNVANDTADAIQAASPKGRIPFHATVTGINSATISSDHPGAKALDKGAYIAPKGHPRLRFSIGGRQVFPKFIRLPARKYVAKGLRQRNKIAKKHFEAWMNK